MPYCETVLFEYLRKVTGVTFDRAKLPLKTSFMECIEIFTINLNITVLYIQFNII